MSRKLSLNACKKKINRPSSRKLPLNARSGGARAGGGENGVWQLALYYTAYTPLHTLVTLYTYIYGSFNRSG
jgi:hypothetical protein